jgi:hypothetical protein
MSQLRGGSRSADTESSLRFLTRLRERPQSMDTESSPPDRSSAGRHPVFVYTSGQSNGIWTPSLHLQTELRERSRGMDIESVPKHSSVSGHRTRTLSLRLRTALWVATEHGQRTSTSRLGSVGGHGAWTPSLRFQTRAPSADGADIWSLSMPWDNLTEYGHRSSVSGRMIELRGRL